MRLIIQTAWNFLAHIPVIASLAFLLPAISRPPARDSQPNPIASQYPSKTTGTINGTLAVLPIPYALARSIIPAKYGILTHAYESYLGSAFGPGGSYPLFLQTVEDHQVQFANGIFCDNMIRFFNTVISQGEFAPVGVQGNITIAAGYVGPTETKYTKIYGIRLDTAFIENNYMLCSQFKGYTYRGE
jgi:hypothetical protein